jgi:hypothetical protein
MVKELANGPLDKIIIKSIIQIDGKVIDLNGYGDSLAVWTVKNGKLVGSNYYYHKIDKYGNVTYCSGIPQVIYSSYAKVKSKEFYSNGLLDCRAKTAH